MRRTLVIIGAGIAGLAAARALAQAGLRSTVLERTAEPAREGAGLQLSPNACHVLRQLGVLRVIAAASFAPQAVLLRRARDGRLLSRFELGQTIRERHGAPYLIVERAVLRNALLAICQDHPDVELRFGEGLADAALHRNGATVLTDAGREIVSAGIVGADGVHSATRRLVPAARAAEPTGWTAWRATAPLPPEMPLPHDASQATNAWLGRSAHLVHYPMPTADRLNLVAVLPEGTVEPPLDWLADWAPAVRETIASAGGWVPWTVRSVPPGAWAHRSALLIGDAAHAMPPYAAQGAAMALEDATTLARHARSHDDLAEAWQAHVRERRPRVRAVAALTAANSRIYHMGRPASLARDLAMGLAPQFVLQRRMDALYGWTPRS